MIYLTIILSLFTNLQGTEDPPHPYDKTGIPIDHLVYAAPSLEEGMDAIEALLGTRPVQGGKHPTFGTHNALLSLGDNTYLEIIAPDPGLEAPGRGRLLEESFAQKPHLATWVMRSESIDSLRAQAVKGGLLLGEVEAGKREKPDGSVLSWKLTDPYALPYQGLLPFLISWGDSPHPAKAVPRAGELIELVLFHPQPQEIRDKLKLLGIDLKVNMADKPSLRARIKTSKGIVTLE